MNKSVLSTSKNILILEIKKKIIQLTQKKRVSSEDSQTILECLRIPLLRESLLNIKEINSIFTNIIEKEDYNSLEKLRLLCQGIWLEETNGFALSTEGDILIGYNQNKLYVSNQIKDKTQMLHRQAIMRQIERLSVFEQNSLTSVNPKTILDVGAGTLIGSTMLRKLYPKSLIDALEPGYISKKVVNISKNKNINLIHNTIQKFKPTQKYDLIIMHFILEHSIKEAKELIAFSLNHLSEKGKISICVPNYDSFHREFETYINLNRRDKKSRLSLHDFFSGHQVIFSKIELESLIKEVLTKENKELEVQSSTILPRPFAFNIMGGLKKHKMLFTLEKNGHIRGMSDKGSVLCFTIGNTSEHTISIEKKDSTTQEFRKLIEIYLHNLKKHKLQHYLRAIEFLQKNYPNLIDGHKT